MEEFRATPGNDIQVELDALVQQVLRTSKETIARFNDTIVIADPKAAKADPDYADDLSWTFWMAHHNSNIIGKRKEYRNIVPEFSDFG